MHFGEVGRSELGPFGGDRQRVGAVECLHGFREVLQTVVIDGADVVHRFGIMNVHVGSQFEQPVDQNQRGCLANIIRLGLEGQAPHGDGLPGQAALEMLFDFLLQHEFLLLVDPLDRVENSGIEVAVAKRIGQRANIFGKTASAVPDSRKEEREPDPAVVANSASNVIDVGGKMFAQVCHLIDEADLRGQQGIGNVLRQLGAFG